MKENMMSDNRQLHTEKSAMLHQLIQNLNLFIKDSYSEKMPVSIGVYVADGHPWVKGEISAIQVNPGRLRDNAVQAAGQD